MCVRAAALPARSVAAHQNACVSGWPRCDKVKINVNHHRRVRPLARAQAAPAERARSAAFPLSLPVLPFFLQPIAASSAHALSR